MRIPRQLVTWSLASLLSLGVLGLVMQWQHRSIQQRVAVQVPAKPVAGSLIFQEKGCAVCHGSAAGGSSSGPSLRNRQSLTTLPRLVTAMWNHAPGMWREMQARNLPYPALTYEETSQLVTYLYMCGYADAQGDVGHGEQLFIKLRCAECHNKSGPSSTPSIGDAEDPLSWTQALWNHAPGMQEKLRTTGLEWPTLQASDMRDLFAYVRHQRGALSEDPPDGGGDPDHGWELFQQKGCLSCHAISSISAGPGPAFGANRPLPATLSEFGAALLNHFPAMEKQINSQKSQVPRFENHDVADIAVFLYSLHYLEPTGSPQVGKSVFSWRGCNRCHGVNAEGSSAGPALRGRGQPYTAVRLANALWAHGKRMYRSARDEGQPWPVLQDSDIGHLLTFLNTSPEP